ncbi:efflux RND transporter periplasmic adaptor subunit [Myxococcus llanfairpwllgwyngyllgogerychwyrndrobwllllantysiliogogogochensis]|uniref:efflux RND transporter periplasmic adaptor subunit n=1 Tax=Myxococcus llanfairpwllgwyngyllgogerychwyrndrobwllllantysiliogogogochensis TaxID=2590453 RepID=UPI001FE2AF44|nr:efflux RND transporter periplasmic adaptor subunit [Myxococcus llanfairpwllgwyngyllgogerychwyrndrobwllllantysiliogogogochensis]
MDPVLVEFHLPQQALAEVKLGQQVRVRVDVFPEHAWAGVLTTLNPEVEQSSRNVRMRVTIPNADGRLLPGMFAHFVVLAEERNPVVAISATAVLFAPYGDSVFLLEEGQDAAGGKQLVAKQRFVRLGERRGQLPGLVPAHHRRGRVAEAEGHARDGVLLARGPGPMGRTPPRGGAGSSMTTDGEPWA